MEDEVILSLIKSIINDRPMEIVTTELNWSKFRNITDMHMLSNLPAYRLDAFVDMPDELKEYYFQQKSLSILRESVQELSIQALLDKFEYIGIKCMPLKGFVTKQLYPMPDMRSMSDTDILVDCGDLDRLHTIMNEEGFVFDHESIHELVYKNEQIVVELHKSIVPKCNHDSYAYFGDGWSFAKKCSGKEYIYEMSLEDAYAHCVEHLARHYLGGGAGIKNVMDVYMFKKHGLNQGYVDNAMERMGLSRFERKISSLAGLWFGEDSEMVCDEVLNDMASYIINNGVFGTSSSSAVTQVFKAAESGDYKKARFRLYFRWLFIKRSDLEYQYSKLKGRSWLYPFYSVMRWKDIILHRRNNISGRMRVHGVADNEVNAFAEHCENIGLRRSL